MFDNIMTSAKNLVFFLRPFPKFHILIHNVYLELIINYLQNFAGLFVLSYFTSPQSPMENFFLSRFWSNITPPTRVSSAAESILIILNASPLETFETLSLSGPCVLIQYNFAVFYTGRIWCQCSAISSDFFSISSDDMKKMLMFGLRWRAISE